MARGTNVWFNGKVVPVESVKLSLFTHALHYGVGVFEGIRAYKQKSGGGAVFRLENHIDRFFESLKIVDLKIPYTPEQLIEGALASCKSNNFQECYLRPIAYIADGPMGVNPGANPPVDVAILNWEWGAYLGDHGKQAGAKVKISSFIRPHVNASMTKGKITGQYVNSVLAKREAIAAGCDEALLLDTEGFVAEASGENVFIVKHGVVKTTPLTAVLNGITRDTVIAYFKRQGTDIREERFTRDELWCADEVFFTGTAAEITPVREVDGRPIGSGDAAGKVGPVTAKLQKDYQDIVRGASHDYPADWLSPIK